MVLTGGDRVSAGQGRRHLGHQHARRLGLCDHQLRLVGRHRPRRDVYQRVSAAAAAGLAHLDQSIRRSDDALRRRVRRHVPAAAPGPAVGVLLADAVSEHDAALAAVPQPAGVGRVRGQHLCDGVADVLVCRPDSGSGDAARSLASTGLRRSSTACCRWAGAIRPGTGSAISPPTCCWPVWRRRWWSRCTASWVWTSPADRCRAGTARSSRRTSSRAPSSAASRWC